MDKEQFVKLELEKETIILNSTAELKSIPEEINNSAPTTANKLPHEETKVLDVSTQFRRTLGTCDNFKGKVNNVHRNVAHIQHQSSERRNGHNLSDIACINNRYLPVGLPPYTYGISHQGIVGYQTETDGKFLFSLFIPFLYLNYRKVHVLTSI